MKKLEDIPKKDIHQVPDGYFDKLPGIIQARLSNETPQRNVFASPVWQYAAIAVIVGFVALGYVFTRNNDPSLTPEELLASIETAELEAYLQDEWLITQMDLAEEEITSSDAEEIEDLIYLETESDAGDEWIDEILIENEFNSEDQ